MQICCHCDFYSGKLQSWSIVKIGYWHFLYCGAPQFDFKHFVVVGSPQLDFNLFFVVGDPSSTFSWVSKARQ